MRLKPAHLQFQRRKVGFFFRGRTRSALFLPILLLIRCTVYEPIACPSQGEPTEDATISHVIDRDTIVLDTGEEVRYLGIDTPEASHHGGPEATKANIELVAGKEVQLWRDGEDRDHYGRLFRYVCADGVFVNAELIRLGWGYASSFSADEPYRCLFRELQEEAREARRGVWADWPTPIPIFLTPVEEVPLCE